MSFIKWVEKVFQDVDGAPSSKRVFAFISLCTLLVLTFCDIYLHLKVERYMYETFRDIVFFGIGLSGAEKFTNRPNKDKTKKHNSTEDSTES